MKDIIGITILYLLMSLCLFGVILGLVEETGMTVSILVFVFSFIWLLAR